jgi:hypothetical protein
MNINLEVEQSFPFFLKEKAKHLSTKVTPSCQMWLDPL